ncbi:hypothetical protein Ddye_020442 [Dipteronia dyeriana]|uniref:Uncharacterized protein n=1 Tax=Dipteronia dyeriana TaxID=168575 RepID=A0AAD9TZX3_9ROSI|nr:hypothetical protein Ddye_020442 [Dipteronia dyeriana]
MNYCLPCVPRRATCQGLLALMHNAEYVTRRSQSIRSPCELVVATAKLREIKALFDSYGYRHRIARDAEERQCFSERIIVLLADDAIEACDFMVWASKRLMQNEQDAMLDLVEPKPKENWVQ